MISYILSADNTVNNSVDILAIIAIFVSLISFFYSCYVGAVSRKHELINFTNAEKELIKLPGLLSKLFQCCNEENIQNTILQLAVIREKLVILRYIDIKRYEKVLDCFSSLDDHIMKVHNSFVNSNQREEIESIVEKLFKLILKPKY